MKMEDVFSNELRRLDSTEELDRVTAITDHVLVLFSLLMAGERSKRVRSAVVTRIAGSIAAALSTEVMTVTLKKSPMADEELLCRIGTMAGLILDGAKIDAAEAAEEMTARLRKFEKGNHDTQK
jgi:hypothetical protein